MMRYLDEESKLQPQRDLIVLAYKIYKKKETTVSVLIKVSLLKSAWQNMNDEKYL